MQFLYQGLDDLVSSLDKDASLRVTTQFLRDYIKRIDENPELLHKKSLGLYNDEIAGVTFQRTVAKKKKTNKKKKSVTGTNTNDDEDATSETEDTCSASTSNSTSRGCSSNDRNFLDDDVTVTDDEEGEEDDDEYEESEETEEDRAFIDDIVQDDVDNDNDDESIHRMFDNISNNNNNNNNNSNITPPRGSLPEGDYRRNPYTPPELSEDLQKQFDEMYSLIKEKGVYFYEYVTDLKVLDETEIPDEAAFYSKLKIEGIDAKKHQRAKDVFKKFKMTSLWQYMSLYLIMDVVLLADVILAFKKMCIKNYSLDPLHSHTTPGYGWQALLKKTKADLDLFSEEQKDLYLFFEEAKRGGLSTISNRHGKAENLPGRPGYDPEKPPTWLMYLDANNLYGG